MYGLYKQTTGGRIPVNGTEKQIKKQIIVINMYYVYMYIHRLQEIHF